MTNRLSRTQMSCLSFYHYLNKDMIFYQWLTMHYLLQTTLHHSQCKIGEKILNYWLERFLIKENKLNLLTVHSWWHFVSVQETWLKVWEICNLDVIFIYAFYCYEGTLVMKTSILKTRSNFSKYFLLCRCMS